MTNKDNKLKKYLKKFWWIVWQDDSFKGWIISLIFIFVVIKLIFFPLLSLATGSSMPLAIVESCSMYHKGDLFSDFDKWWEKHEEKYEEFEITKKQFEEFEMKRGFNKGDILLITKPKPEKIEEGDIIIFKANRRNPVIHRIIEKNKTPEGYYFSTIGDNNNRQIPSEKTIHEKQIVGKAEFKILPLGGWIKLVFYEPFRPESQKGFCEQKTFK